MHTETAASLTLSPEATVPPVDRKVSGKSQRPLRILLVTPEICDSSLLGEVNGGSLCVKAGGLADMSGLLLDSLAGRGMDMHVALPENRSPTNDPAISRPSAIYQRLVRVSEKLPEKMATKGTKSTNRWKP